MTSPVISICIPTFNRATNLENCLQSILHASKGFNEKFEVCISNNGSTDNTDEIVKRVGLDLNINYHKNDKNLGIPKNFLKVVSLAQGEFIWLIGDDDLLLPDTFTRLIPLIADNKEVDFFYLNSYHLDHEYVKSKKHPFNTDQLPKNMEPFSKEEVSRKLQFFDLIDPKISFDFLGGMFLSLFRKKNWDKYVNILSIEALESSNTFSHFDNTFPHIKIWANAFSDSPAYFNNKPMNVCITGVREWAPMEPLIRNIRLIEALDEYKNQGLPLLRYVYCKNFALRNYFSNTIKILLNRDIYLFEVNLFKHYLKCAMYPNVYLSFLYITFRKIKIFLLKDR